MERQPGPSGNRTLGDLLGPHSCRDETHPSQRSDAGSEEGPPDAWPAVGRFTRPTCTQDVLKQVFAWEARQGPLTRAARARLVRYAAGLGVSAERAGIWLTELTRSAERESKTAAPQLTLLPDDPDARVPFSASQRRHGLIIILGLVLILSVFLI